MSSEHIQKEEDVDALFASVSSKSHVFPLKSADISLLSTPTQFYEQLLDNIRKAEHRISISSLYLGTGELEQRLVSSLGERLRERPELQVTIVLDYSRGQRGGDIHSSVGMLSPLLREFPSNVHLSLYKVPQLKGLKAMFPPPFNETMGVLHSKVYLVDDQLVMSGANLSSDYFTNRQDRYVFMQHCGSSEMDAAKGGLSTFYHSFVHLLTMHSYTVQVHEKQGYELLPPSSSHPSDLKKELEKLFETDQSPSSFDATEEMDAWASPTIQFSPLDVTQDERMLIQFVKELPQDSHLAIASGYLNFPRFLSDFLIQSHVDLDVLTAAPIANGFYTATDVKGALPMAYSLIEQDFYERSRQHLRPNKKYETTIREFQKTDWTFHGKGMWWSPSRTERKPWITVFGSSNFGQRSYGYDLESQVVLYTKNDRLQRDLKHEYESMHEPAEVVTDQLWKRPERNLQGMFSWKTGHWIRPVAKMIAAYL